MIDVKNVYKTFFVPQEVQALHDVSYHINPGEVVVVIGPSGSGKSTFLRCLNRLEHAESGHIMIDGVDVLDRKTNINKVRMEVGMVFQSFNLFPHLTVLENVTVGQTSVRKRGKKEAAETAMTLLNKVGIHAKADNYPAQLSGGQMQRVAIARALVHEPALVLCDEPTGNLDPERASGVLALLFERIQAAGAIAILVTHSLAAAAHADRTLRLTANGLVDATGTE
jgi:polar amino acid transport system ATP-binding protein